MAEWCPRNRIVLILERGPRYRPRSAIVLILGTPKTGIPNFRNPVCPESPSLSWGLVVDCVSVGDSEGQDRRLFSFLKSGCMVCAFSRKQGIPTHPSDASQLDVGILRSTDFSSTEILFASEIGMNHRDPYSLLQIPRYPYGLQEPPTPEHPHIENHRQARTPNS